MVTGFILRASRRAYASAASVGLSWICFCAIALVAFWAAAVMMMLGMNWYLFYFGPAPGSGQPALNPTVTALILSAAAWGIGFGGLFVVTYALHRGSQWAAARVPTPRGFMGHCDQWHTGVFDGTLRSLLSRRGALTLTAVAVCDALGGVTATYAAPHTPQLLQLALTGCGFFAAFGVTRLLVPERALRMTPLVACSMLCLVGSVVAAAVPQLRSSMRTFNAGSAGSWGWLLIFGLNSLFPVLVNVFQARFLVTALGSAREHGALDAASTIVLDDDAKSPLLRQTLDGAESDQGSVEVVVHEAGIVADVPAVGIVASPGNGVSHARLEPCGDEAPEFGWCVRSLARVRYHAPYRRLLDRAVVCFFMLAWDTVVQVFILLALAPLDALPWFGSSPNVAATWASLQQGALCTFEHIQVCRERGTGGAFAWYVIGFFLQHFGAACINYRLSPIFGAAAMGAVVPLNMIALWAVPAWNVFGASSPGWVIAVSTVCAGLGVMLQIAKHAQKRWA